MLCLCVLNNGGRVRAQSAAECKQERKILVNACKAVITRKPPTPYCCERLRVTHVSCVCPVITPQLAALIDVNYAIKVIQGCGIQVPRHFKCGIKLSSTPFCVFFTQQETASSSHQSRLPPLIFRTIYLMVLTKFCTFHLCGYNHTMRSILTCSSLLRL